MMHIYHYLHLKLLTQTWAKKIMQLGNPIPFFSELNHHFTLKKKQFCVFSQTYVHVTPSKRSRRNAEKVCSSRKKGKHTVFLWVSHGGSKACCLYIIQIYIYIYEFYIFTSYQCISLKITGHASSGFLRGFGAAPRYGLVMSE